MLTRAGTVARSRSLPPAILRYPAYAAEFDYKCGTKLPDGHPMHPRPRGDGPHQGKSGGRLAITLYVNSVLCQDTAMISQAISARCNAITCRSTCSPCATRPAASLQASASRSTATRYIWEAMDVDLGYLRELSAEQIGFRVMPKGVDHRFRHVTIRGQSRSRFPDDLKGSGRSACRVRALSDLAVVAYPRLADPNQFRRGL